MEFKAHQQDIHALSAAADGHTIATCSNDGTIKLWDIRYASGSQPRLNLSFHSLDGPSDVAFSPDSRFLACSFFSGSIHLLDGKTGQLLREFHTVYQVGIYCVRFSPDGQTLICSAANKSIYTWDIADLQTVYSPQPIKELILHRVSSLHRQIILSNLIMYPRTPCFTV